MTIEIKKEENLYRVDQKKKWFGYGEWVEEADVVEFTYNGYECLIHRVCKREPFAVGEVYFGGHLCGYVKIPEDHPLFGKGWEDVTELNCHGGITANEYHEEHWIGFDCAHSGDYCPSTEKFKKELGNELFPIPKEFMKYSMFNPVYKNINYVTCELKELVDQLVEIKKEAATTNEKP